MNVEVSTEFNKKNMGLLRDIYYPWSTNDQNFKNSNKMINLYEKLFLDMITNAEVWASFWENYKNIVWCERSVGVINTYATILRQKAEKMQNEGDSNFVVSLSHCEKVLNLGGRQLALFKTMAYSDIDMFYGKAIELFNSQLCLKGLTYKYFIIKHNLLRQTNRYKKTNVSELMFICEYEIENNAPLMITSIFEILNLSITKQAFSSLSGQQIKDAYCTRIKLMKYFDENQSIYTASKMCGQCGIFAEAGGEKFSVCSRCRTEFYCGKECQKKNWKSHKIICQEVTTTSTKP